MKRKAEPKKENLERWLLTYADLITLLLAFFVVLYATSRVDVQQFKAVAESLHRAFNTGPVDVSGSSSSLLSNSSGLLPDLAAIEAADFKRISDALTGLARKEGISESLRLRQGQDTIVISLSNNLLFDSGSADLRVEAAGVLDEVAAQLRGMPNFFRIEGHTDNVPIHTEQFPSNWELSTARATNVLRWIVDRDHIDPRRGYAAGFADTRPVASNDTPEGRALNRRADIVILYPPPAGVATSTPTAGR